MTNSFATFNAKALLNTVISTKLPTKYPEIPLDGPEGDEFLMRCVKIYDIRELTAKETGDKFFKFESDWEILSDYVKEKTGLDRPIARRSIRIDIDPKTGGFALGKTDNVVLGRDLEACGITSKTWSLSMFRDTTAYGKVRVDKDDDDPDVTYNRVSRLAAKPKA